MRIFGENDLTILKVIIEEKGNTRHYQVGFFSLVNIFLKFQRKKKVKDKMAQQAPETLNQEFWQFNNIYRYHHSFRGSDQTCIQDRTDTKPEKEQLKFLRTMSGRCILRTKDRSTAREGRW